MIKLVAGYELPKEEVLKWCDSKKLARDDGSLYSAVISYMLDNPDRLPFDHFKFYAVSWPPYYVPDGHGRKIPNPISQSHYMFITRYLVDEAFPRRSPWNGEYQAEERDQDRLLKATLVEVLGLPEAKLTFATYPKGHMYMLPETPWEQITIPRPQAPHSTVV
ncbi:hypothetical protein PUNSTDRAFT_50920 [Punctularia strigosozonata HHB-11173 SS5]|uniref:uncharacterized protein n=1 Tax=Punctularia strigosozonata (strain HHB-11173) TaxID=741275 RepID=UPI0004418465|nr:uncharacterized protein PUNSTDRAFT_50920 [Punctularia strigosozonata HHB-11173 SS5]EIN10240.1 hypothetical protein PUNSTDRAFT_50920 [Punctularia strigosozonata HHB-11173 SS5]